MKIPCLTVLYFNFSSLQIILNGKIHMWQFWGFAVCMFNFSCVLDLLNIITCLKIKPLTPHKTFALSIHVGVKQEGAKQEALLPLCDKRTEIPSKFFVVRSLLAPGASCALNTTCVINIGVNLYSITVPDRKAHHLLIWMRKENSFKLPLQLHLQLQQY